MNSFHIGQSVYSPSFGTRYTIVATGSVVCTVRSEAGFEATYPTAALRAVEA